MRFTYFCEAHISDNMLAYNLDEPGKEAEIYSHDVTLPRVLKGSGCLSRSDWLLDRAFNSRGKFITSKQLIYYIRACRAKSTLPSFSILVPRGRTYFGQHQESPPLASEAALLLDSTKNGLL